VCELRKLKRSQVERQREETRHAGVGWMTNKNADRLMDELDQSSLSDALKQGCIKCIIQLKWMGSLTDTTKLSNILAIVDGSLYYKPDRSCDE